MGFHKRPPPVQIGVQPILPYGAYYFCKALPRDQPALHSLTILGWPSLKPQGYGFLQATHRCTCELMAGDVNHRPLLPPQGLLPTQLAILHEDEDAHPYHAVHVR